MRWIIEALRKPYSRLLGGVILSFQLTEDMVIPINQCSDILSRVDFEELVEYCRRFYERYSDEDIAEILAESRKQRAERAMLVSPPEKKIKIQGGFIYILKGGGYYKIGKTTKLGRRMTEIKPKPPFDAELIHSFSSADIEQAEIDLHEKFASKRVNGEWFNLDQTDVNYLMNL